jgi:hypothetical protein
MRLPLVHRGKSVGPIPTFAFRLGWHVCACWNQATAGKNSYLVEFWI